MILVRAVKPSVFKSSVFREEMLVAAKAIQKIGLADFKRTTATWTEQPKWSSKVDQGASVGGVRIQIGTDDPRYGWIDEGTKVRYATMSPDWKSKTQPNVLRSFPGKGKKLFVNKKRPRPGIKARNYTKIIAKDMKELLSQEAKNALARAARRCGHGVT